MTVPSNVINWTELCVHAHLTSNTTLIILLSVNAALDVHNIEKGIFVLQCDIKYWFLKFTIWHIWYLHYDLWGYWELFGSFGNEPMQSCSVHHVSLSLSSSLASASVYSPPSDRLIIEASYLKNICSYAPSICTWNIKSMWHIFFKWWPF